MGDRRGVCERNGRPLHALQREAITQRKLLNAPFILKYFNVKSYYACNSTEGLARFTNPLADALNANHRLPKFIIVIPDKDLLQSTKHKSSFRAARFIGSIIHHLIARYTKLISRREHELEQKFPGAILPYDDVHKDNHPKFIWIRMLKRQKGDVADKKLDELFQLRGKFNSILEERIFEDGGDCHKIMSIDVPTSEFDLAGSLLPHGKEIFWKEVSNAMEKFALGKIKLLARMSQNLVGLMPQGNPRQQIIAAPKHKLPTPPAKPKSYHKLDFREKIQVEVQRHSKEKEDKHHYEKERRKSEDRRSREKHSPKEKHTKHRHSHHEHRHKRR